MEAQSKSYAHHGWMMRSHTELLWARVFDAAKIQYLHEPGVFNTPRGWYLPDFYMPNIGVYVEIKGVEPSDIEKQKAVSVMEQTGKHLVIIQGKPQPDRNGFCSCKAHFCLSGKWTSVPMCTYSDIYIDLMGASAWMSLCCAGTPSDEGDVMSASEIMAEWVPHRFGRAFYEKQAKASRDENAQKVLESLPAQSMQEREIQKFFNQLQEKYKWPSAAGK